MVRNSYLKEGFLICFILVVSTVFIGCYTVLLHPKFKVTDDRGDASAVYVDHVDDCAECHGGSMVYSTPIGMGAAHNFESWRFYYEYPWWRDNYGDYAAGSTVDLPEARDMGRRRGSYSGDNYSPTATPVAPTQVPVLTKSAAGNVNSSGEGNVSSQPDSRRTIDRRTHSTSDTKKRKSGRRKKE